MPVAMGRVKDIAHRKSFACKVGRHTVTLHPEHPAISLLTEQREVTAIFIGDGILMSITGNDQTKPLWELPYKDLETKWAYTPESIKISIHAEP